MNIKVLLSLISKFFNSFIKEEKAQAAVEYIFMASILIIVSYLVIRTFISVWDYKFNIIKDNRSSTQGMLP